MLKNVKWGYTSEIKEEYLNYNLQKFIPINEGFQVPASEQELRLFQDQHPFIHQYDLPDQTLALCTYRDNSILLTDDGGLLMEIEELGLKGFLLPTFSLFMVKAGMMKKNIFAKMVKFWEIMGSYSSQHLKRWKQELQEIT
ncbi:MAG: hypothetical protein ACTSVZ_00665 [Promethearchaeota archaeon]